MEKTETKRAKRKTLQITYPAPYSQSWNPDVLPVLMKNSVGRSTRSRRPLQSPRVWSQPQFPDRPDPTAPHLKYGVFRNRRGSAPSGPLIQDGKRLPLPEKQIKPNRNPSHVVKVSQELSKRNPMQSAQKKSERKKGNSQLPPVFAIRSIHINNSRKLSLSKTMHIDIKPKRSAFHSPSFCPSPNFRALSRNI